MRQAQTEAVNKFVDDVSVPVERITVPASSMRAVAARPEVPEYIRKMPIEVNFPPQSDLGALVFALSSVNLQVAFQWADPTQSEAVLQKKLPFVNFEGSVGELLSALRNGLGLVSWYEDGMIYLSDQQRYALTLPQNTDVLDSVSKEIEQLGASDIVTSVRGGKIIYSASPTVQDELIGPFLDRMERNLAVVNMQVAVVSLSLNDSSEVGFDWDAFKVAFDSTQGGISAASGAESAPAAGDADGEGEQDSGAVAGTIGSIVGSGLSLSHTNLGNVFGTYGALTISSAVKFLSTFGHTNVTQHVSLKTLSGSKVELQSGQEVPYVTGVSTTSDGDNTIGASDTDTVETGLKLELEPYYDGDSQIVTVDVSVDLNQILQFVELSAGDQIGSLTQPLVQKQNMKDLVRVRAGKTVVIGGLQYDSDTKSANEPSVIRKRLEGTGRMFGKDSRDVQRSALFIILRPTVTVFERER